MFFQLEEKVLSKFKGIAKSLKSKYIMWLKILLIQTFLFLTSFLTVFPKGAPAAPAASILFIVSEHRLFYFLFIAGFEKLFELVFELNFYPSDLSSRKKIFYFIDLFVFRRKKSCLRTSHNKI